MPRPDDYLRACNCATWQGARSLIETGHQDDAVLQAAWHAIAKLAPPFDVQTEFCSDGAPQVPKIIWQRRFNKACTQPRYPALRSAAELLIAISDTSRPVADRLTAIEALGKMRHRPAILPLLQAMHEATLANACAQALIALGSRRHLRRLVKLLMPTTPDFLKQEAIYCLWILLERRGATSLARIALDRTRESDDTRSMATEALGNNVHKPYIQRVLAKALNDPVVDVRMSALCASGCLFDRQLLPVLRRAIDARRNDPELNYEEAL